MPRFSVSDSGWDKDVLKRHPKLSKFQVEETDAQTYIYIYTLEDLLSLMRATDDLVIRERWGDSLHITIYDGCLE